MTYEFEYMNHVQALFQKIHDSEKETIKQLAAKFAENIKNNRIIHTFGTGHSHMIGIELFARAGGLANVNAILDPDVLTAHGARRSGELEKLVGLADIIYDQYHIQADDIMIIISNSGRNAVPIEIAQRAKKEGVFTIALTNLAQSQKQTSRHPSGKKLYEIVDVVLDNGVPDGDSLMTVGTTLTGPGSTLASVFLLNTIVSEALKLLHAEGEELPVFQSQNVDGFNNDALYARYAGRIKSF